MLFDVLHLTFKTKLYHERCVFIVVYKRYLGNTPSCVHRLQV